MLIVLLTAAPVMAFLSSRLYLSPKRFPVLSRFQPQLTSPRSQRVRPTIAGHRGAGLCCTVAPGRKKLLIGNTQKSIQAAIDAKVDWIEIDVRLSKDNRLIVFHDETVDARTSSCGAVSQLTLQQLKACQLNVDPPVRILTLDEVFQKFPDPRLRWILDIKSQSMSTRLHECLQRHRIDSDRVLVFGEYSFLKEYKGKGYRLGYTTIFRSSFRRVVFTPADIFDRCNSLRCTLLVLPVALVTPSLVAKAQDRNIEIWCFDADEPAELFYAVDHCGVTGIVVDKPSAARRQFMDRAG